MTIPATLPHDITIRMAHEGDSTRLAALAQLDSAEALTGTIVMAEADGRLLAALSLGDRAVVADPFSPTADLVELLGVHADQLAGPGRHSRGRRLVARAGALASSPQAWLRAA